MFQISLLDFSVYPSQFIPALQKYGFQLVRTPVRGCESISFGSDKYWECAMKRQTGPENHQAGSCKMGPASDHLAVVNPLLQVTSPNF